MNIQTTLRVITANCMKKIEDAKVSMVEDIPF